MKKTPLFLVLLVLLMGSVPVLADGKFYWSEEVPPEIPYQRALLLFDGKQETLLVQSEYRVATSAGGGFGWVVPVPSVPELASMDADEAGSLFRYVDFVTSPRLTRISDMLLGAFLILVLLGAALTLVACLLSLFFPRMQYVRQHRAALLTGALLILLPLLTFLGWSQLGIQLFFVGPVCAALALLACLHSPRVPRLHHYLKGNRVILTTSALLSLVVFGLMAVDMYSAQRGESAAAEGVEIIRAEQVGIYDVQVVKANQAESLIEWLNKNEFRFDESDQQVFNDYLRRGWCFVVAQIDPSRSTDQGEVVSEGLVAPLIMRFQADAPIYPLALTSTAGQETQILLYLFSQDRWTSDGRLELHYASGEQTRLWGSAGWFKEFIGRHVEPSDFFSEGESALPHLCKFKGTLEPEQMQEDLVFARAENEKPYRKRIIVW